ncbi:MAG TPA: twin-arginine translocase TatA/TatE family subunit [Azospirillum sp.]
MGSFSIWHWLVVLVIVLLLFGAGKLPKVAGDLAKGIKNFKAGLKDEDETAAPGADAKVLPNQPAPPADAGVKDAGVKKDEAART